MVDEDLWERLDGLEDRFSIGGTECVIIAPSGATSDDVFGDWPDDTPREDITLTYTEEAPVEDKSIEWEKVLVPVYRPPKYRSGLVIMSEKEVAHVYASMPDDVREKELEYRVEHGKPIPPVLQQ